MTKVPLFAVLVSLLAACVVSEGEGEVISFATTSTSDTAQALLGIDSLVAPYAQDSDLQEKRNDVIDVIVDGAVGVLTDTCTMQNEIYAQQEGKTLCADVTYCPDVSVLVRKSSNEFTLDAFFETTDDFNDVQFGFSISWNFGSSDGIGVICYAPSIHPSIRDLRTNLVFDPFLLNRVSATAN